MTTLLTEKKTITISRTFVVGIHREGKALLVRKSEIISGIRVPLDETYVLDIDSAVTTQSQWINKIHGFTLN